ncbi:hypothetical protein L0F63_001028 [Massospora cicadina]|nr:hypothetical protein L0F63_001028 [Massospora cicadina]
MNRPTDRKGLRNLVVKGCPLQVKATFQNLRSGGRLRGETKLVAEPVDPLDERVVNLIANLRTSSTHQRIKSDPQDIERVYRPRGIRRIGLEAYNKLCRGISESFTVAQLKAYIASYNPALDPVGLAARAIPLHVRWKAKRQPTRHLKKEDLAANILTMWGVGAEEEFITVEAGENLRRLELLGNSTIEIDIEAETYTIRGDPSEIKKTRALISETIRAQTLDLDFSKLAEYDPNFLRGNRELIAGVAQVAGTYVTGSLSPTGQRINISGLQRVDIIRTQHLLEEAWRLIHPPVPRAVFLHTPDELPEGGLVAFPASDPAYMPDFYRAQTMFWLRPPAELGPMAHKLRVEASDRLVLQTHDDRLAFRPDESAIQLRDLPELLLQSVRRPGFETQLEARFGHVLNFDRHQLHLPAYFNHPVGDALADPIPVTDSFFLLSFPRHRVWEAMVPLKEVHLIELEYRASALVRYRDPSAYCCADVSPPTLCVTLTTSATGPKVLSARVFASQAVADINMLACPRSLRLVASSFKGLPLSDYIAATFSTFEVPGELELPLSEGRAVYRLGAIRHPAITAYNHPCSGSDLDSLGCPPVVKVVASRPASEDLSALGLGRVEPGVEPYAGFIRDSLDLCQY